MHQWHRVEERPGAIGADIGTGSRHNLVPVQVLDTGTSWWQLKTSLLAPVERIAQHQNSRPFCLRDILSPAIHLSRTSLILSSLSSLILYLSSLPRPYLWETGSGGAHERRRRERARGAPPPRELAAAALGGRAGASRCRGSRGEGRARRRHRGNRPPPPRRGPSM